MSSGKVLITVDALGADNAPSVVLDGVKLALEQDECLNILLCGPKDVVEPFCEANDRCQPVVCTESIEMGEHPAMAARKKKDSTIVVGSRLVKENKADGFFSAGNTGACLAAATLITGRIKGISRPMLASNIPCVNGKHQTLLCDLGANADCKPENLLQFSYMAKAYLKKVKGIDNPRIALLNIGEEETKGSSFAQETYKLLSEKLDCFVGNAEGKDIITDKFDAVITDGFTGNIVLKSIEGTVKSIFKLFKSVFMINLKTKIGALLVKANLKSAVKIMDPEAAGSALLFGVKGACCVGHGSSSANEICNGILTTANIVKNDIVAAIENELKNDSTDEQ